MTKPLGERIDSCANAARHYVWTSGAFRIVPGGIHCSVFVSGFHLKNASFLKKILQTLISHWWEDQWIVIIFPTKLASNEREATSAPQRILNFLSFYYHSCEPCISGSFFSCPIWTNCTVDGLPSSQRQSLDIIESTRRPKTVPKQNFMVRFELACYMLSATAQNAHQCYNVLCLRILGQINTKQLKSWYVLMHQIPTKLYIILYMICCLFFVTATVNSKWSAKVN